MAFVLPLLPILFAIATAFAPSGVGRRQRLWLTSLAVAAMTLTASVAVFGAAGGWTGRIAWHEPLGLTAALPPLAGAMAVLVPLIALPVLAYAAFHEEAQGLQRLLAILLVFVGGMELLVVAADFLTLLIGWELVGVCSYLLIAHEWHERENAASGLYAFLMTRFGDLGLFAAAMAVFATTGSFSYGGLGHMEGGPAAVAGFGLLMAAASKSGQIPFAPWLFRAMAGPTSVSALLHAATMVAAGAFILLRLEPFLASVPGLSGAIIAVGAATALSGGIVALLQTHAKRLLAASTSGHYGLMFVAVGAGYPAVAFLHLTAHAAFKALLFLAAGLAHEKTGSYDLSTMRLGRALPLAGLLTLIGTLSLAGLPPLGGGWTKEAVVTAAEHWSVWATGSVILAGALSAAYAARFQLSAFGLLEIKDGDNEDEGETAPLWPQTRARQIEIGAMALLAIFILVTSLLWLPPVRMSAEELLQAALPQASVATLILSLVAVGFGLLIGTLIARQYRTLGADGPAAEAAHWLGLPALIDAAITRPVLWLSRVAAKLDDRLIDGAVRFLVLGGRSASWVLRQTGEAGAEGFVTQATNLVGSLSRTTSRFGEWLTDGVVEGLLLTVGQSGRDARRLQTGLSHHYYAIATLGGGAAIILLLSLS
ncbi:NADH ubiquinone/plastoquinone complex subunit, putative [Fulvimarina pelagi HTCC2506]|uniref:NADH ubiquinone/plastoquinone complex subunit, putative n=1 Tax=Fulvimarina pelagi HTCC2506 TaxID=314231 RepID=Q0FXV9_9HYPH|nr:proton-conducting transporter membrane subunit [Fulvimarina pelagi]EAU39774.1 NADH ubiquinone/plastoquinone complex subunit, putative [Fulvimarina pelagi HTCC2506]